MKFIKTWCKGGTFALIFFEPQKRCTNSYLIQFSLKKPWIKPRKEMRYNNGSWLAGWLFFYVGKIVS